MDKIYKTYLFHYNPNHDKLGRFAKSVGGSSDYVLPKKPKYIELVVQRTKMKILKI